MGSRNSRPTDFTLPSDLYRSIAFLRGVYSEASGKISLEIKEFAVRNFGQYSALEGNRNVAGYSSRGASNSRPFCR
jgi:hypothetical protein